MEDTIAAISSGLTDSGIGIVRVSGPEAVKIGDEVLRLKKGKLSDYPARTVHFVRVYDGETEIDEAIAFILKAPASYTGEDTVEIQGHGGPYVLRRILETVTAAGARMAEPGEFSRRAFMNGRLDLSQAEAVMDVIRAQNEFARKTSIERLSGSVRDKVRDLRKQLIGHIAFIEAALDDPEHISVDGYGETLSANLCEITDEITEMINNADSGRILSEGIRTVILGRPNAGKSSLLNLLSGYERAIVTEIAGTTRDVLEEKIRLRDLTLRLIDTAGLRDTDDRIEQIGVEKAKKEAEEADLILYIIDSSDDLSEDDIEALRSIEERRAVVLLNKSDLEVKLTPEDLASKTTKPVLLFSATEGHGKKELEDCIYDMFIEGKIRENKQITIVNLRHKASLKNALESIRLANESIRNGMPEDFFSIDLMDAYKYLGEITGDQVDEDLINEIFSNFCLGK